MNWTWILANSNWLVPLGLVATNVIVKLTPYRGDDSLLDILIDSYCKVTNRGSMRGLPEKKDPE